MPQPQRVRDSQRLAEDALELAAGHSGIAGLDFWVEQAFLGGEQCAAAVHVDTAAFEDDLAVDQRPLELLRRPHGNEIVLLPVVVFGPRIEMKARDREPVGLPHEDGTEIPGPAAVRRKSQEMHLTEMDADPLEEPRRLRLVPLGIDEETHALARGQVPDDLAVDPGDRLELP